MDEPKPEVPSTFRPGIKVVTPAGHFATVVRVDVQNLEAVVERHDGELVSLRWRWLRIVEPTEPMPEVTPPPGGGSKL